jgi:2-polyprenyl-3-methyl-5-hydroxy-6-metoxy-1,4-benzoquinol methylase
VTHAEELAQGKRFPFGENWALFLERLDDARIDAAERSVRDLVGDVDGLRFLDIGCGSGLFSLVARRLGATVHSFDFDPLSVGCARELKRRYFPDDPEWTVEEGSVLDRNYLEALGHFDVVYSWGVLHHTGHMWDALGNATLPVAPGGRLVIAIYNDQGWLSNAWKGIKRTYCSGRLGKAAVSAWWVPTFYGAYAAYDLLRGRPPWRRSREHKADRGMSIYRDIHDWLGGYPFEVASVQAIFDFFAQRGFRLDGLTTVGGSSGNNEFLFVRDPGPTDKP